jgi:translation initiation factor 2 beta subunit (eIF-2beta)/eIF-5
MEKVHCPDCGRVITHYIGGHDSVYSIVCPRCGGKTKHIIIIYSAGKTAVSTETKIEINIKFSAP